MATVTSGVTHLRPSESCCLVTHFQVKIHQESKWLSRVWKAVRGTTILAVKFQGFTSIINKTNEQQQANKQAKGKQIMIASKYLSLWYLTKKSFGNLIVSNFWITNAVVISVLIFCLVVNQLYKLSSFTVVFPKVFTKTWL